jgi:hypothetical protein
MAFSIPAAISVLPLDEPHSFRRSRSVEDITGSMLVHLKRLETHIATQGVNNVSTNILRADADQQITTRKKGDKFDVLMKHASDYMNASGQWKQFNCEGTEITAREPLSSYSMT